MNSYNRMKFLLDVSLMILITSSVDISDTKISTNRNSYRESICEYYSQDFTDADRQAASSIINGYTYLTDAQIKEMLLNMNFSSPATPTILMAVPHAIALVVLLLLWPGLCCCCVWPQKYPICGTCRKPQKQLYEKCQLKWPAYFTLFLYLLIITGSGAAIYAAADITNHVNNFNCRTMAIFDDTLYGRVSPSDDSVFFVGLSPLKDELTSFKSSYATFHSQSNTALEAEGENVRLKQQAIEDAIDTDYSAYVNIEYENAFTESDGVTYVNVSSEFKTMYFGPPTNTSTILGNIQSQLSPIFSEVNSALDPMISTWDYLESEGQTSTTGKITTTINTLEQLITSLSNSLDTMGASLDMTSQLTSINAALTVFYALILTLSIIGAIGALVLTCCSIVKARHIIYCTCASLLLLGIVSFVLLLVMAVMLPSIAQMCAYADTQLADSNKTVNLFGSANIGSDVTLFSECMPDGNGDIISSVSSNFAQSFNAFVTISQNTLQFNDLIPNFSTQALEQPFTQAANVIDSVNTSSVLDIQDSVGIDHLNAVADKTYSIDSVQCTQQANVNADSWTPNYDVIGCAGGSFKQPPCTDLSDTGICPVGCYEIFDQLTSASGDSAAYTTNLQTRYGTGCNYALYVINLHDNWNQPRSTYLDSVQSTLDTEQTRVNQYDTMVKSIQASLNSFKSNLQANFDSQTNLTSGSFNGVDCRVLGQSIQDWRDAGCVGVLSSIQYNFIMLALISYGILFLACCGVCAGVRHFKHSQKMNIKVGYKGVPISISSNRILNRFDK